MNKFAWKTKGTAIAALVTIIGPMAKLLLDGDPKTNPDWNTSIPLILAALGVLFARQNNQSSEDVGIKGPVPN